MIFRLFRFRPLIFALVGLFAGTVRADVARSRFQAAMQSPASAEGRFSAAQIATIVPLLMSARTQTPPTPGIYDPMADPPMQAEAAPSCETLQVLLDSVNQFPRRLGLAYQAAVLCLRVGENTSAGVLVERGLQLAPEETARARFAALKAGLPRCRASHRWPREK